MKIIRRYLLLDMLKPTFVALFVVLSIIWLLRSLRFMDYIINRGLDAGDFLLMTSMLLPSLLVFVLPIAFLVGLCFAYKRLIDDSEMDALLAVGVSRIKILVPGFIAALVVCTIGYINAFWLMPYSKTAFKEFEQEIRGTQSVFLLEEGTFNPINEDLTIYMTRRDVDGTLRNLLIYDGREKDRPATWLADSGRLVKQGDSIALELQRAARLEANNDQLFTLAFNRSTISLRGAGGDKGGTRFRKADERSLTELLNTEGLRSKQANEFNAEIVRRFVWPFTPIPLVFLVGLFMVRGVKSRFGHGRFIAYAAVSAISYFAILAVCHSLAEKGNTFGLVFQFVMPVAVCAVIFNLMRDRTREVQHV